MTQAYTNRFTEVHRLAGYLPPQSLGVGVHTYAYYNAANYQRGILLLLVGTMGGGATLDCQIWQATDALGANAKIVAGKAITQLSAAAGDGNDAVAIELRTEELDVNGGFCYVSAIVTVGGAAVNAAVAALAGCANYVPVPVAAWTEIVD